MQVTSGFWASLNHRDRGTLHIPKPGIKTLSHGQATPAQEDRPAVPRPYATSGGKTRERSQGSFFFFYY